MINLADKLQFLNYLNIMLNNLTQLFQFIQLAFSNRAWLWNLVQLFLKNLSAQMRDELYKNKTKSEYKSCQQTIIIQILIVVKLCVGQNLHLKLDFRLQFQMINTNSFIFFLIVLFILIEFSLNYKITTGKRATVEKELQIEFKGKRQAQSNGSLYSRFFIFPYDVYEYHINDTTNNTYIRSFIFVKSDYEYTQSFMNIPNTTLNMQNQIKILYGRIPQIMQVVGQNNELLEIDLIDFNLESKRFVIKNSTVDKIQNMVRVYDLNFYYLQINKYLLKVINVAYYKTSENETAAMFKDYELSVFQQGKGKKLDQLKKHKFVLQKILNNQTFWEKQDFTNHLFSRIFSRKIRQTSKWKAIFDGFTIKYFSADIYRMNIGSLNENDYIELVRMDVSEGEIKQSKIIRQPLKYLKISQLEYIDLCRSGQKLSVLFSDKIFGYVIDITKEEWHLLQRIKIAPDMLQFQFVFFGKDCKVFGLHQISEKKNQTSSKSSLIVQYHPKKQNIKKIDMKVSHYFKPILNFIILCDIQDNCSLFQTQKFNQVNQIISRADHLMISSNQKVYYRLALEEGEVQHLLQIQYPKQKKQRWVEITPNNTLIKDFVSLFLHPVYQSLVYRNKTNFISKQMNRQVYEHIKQASYLQNNKQKQSYYEQIFKYKNTADNCLVPFNFESTIVEVKFNQTNKWSVCIWEQQIYQYTELIMTFKERYLNYQLYLCSSFLEKYSDRMNIECVSLLDQIGPLTQTKTLSVIQQLKSSHFYKLYIVKQNQVQQKYLPTIYVKDVQRQQIEVASTLFFFIMIVLSLLLLGLVLFVTLKSLVINLLIYYGVIQQRNQPNYPLAWFPLKTKLKRMQQHGVLKYVEYQPSISDTEGNHCCFCLDLIKQKALIAQIYCSHEFHKQCFIDWIRNQPNAKCPTCRRHFTRSGLIQYQDSISSRQQIHI